ncbi:complement regulatory protein [Trypanosoma cruzi]|nr:complement regulatory protein [Trypanosoma cruzi]
MDSDPDSLSNSDLIPLDGTTVTPEPSTALANAERVLTCRVAVMPHRIICAQRLGNQRSHRSTTQHHLCATVFVSTGISRICWPWLKLVKSPCMGVCLGCCCFCFWGCGALWHSAEV